MRSPNFLIQKAESAFYERKSYSKSLSKEQERKINCCLNCEKNPSECNGDCELMRTKRRKK